MLIGDDVIWLKEILHDAESCARLTDWEENFLDDMRVKVMGYGSRTHVSERQMEVLKRIEEKIYQ